MGRPTTGYHLPDGTKVPGTTSITGRFKDSAGLMGWSYKMGLAVGKRIQAGELTDKDAWKQEVRYGQRDEAAEVGTLMHDLIEADLTGSEKPEIPEHLADKVRECWEGYERWKALMPFTVYLAEEPLVSEQYRFGGTPDLVALTQADSFLLVDYKSGKDFYPDMIVQAAAYRYLLAANRDIVIDTAHVWRFKNGKFRAYDITKQDLECGWKAFQHMRALYDLDAELKERAA